MVKLIDSRETVQP